MNLILLHLEVLIEPHEMFYRKGTKVIKFTIENYMTPLCLAV